MSSNSDKEVDSDNESEKKSQRFSLQLSDIIQIEAPSSKVIDGKIFIIEYIDSKKIRLINTDDLTPYKIKINEDGTISDSSITSISLLDRSEKLGYARQNNLLPGTWINIYIGGDMPVILTGEITNLEEDMIELKTYPDNDILYINFGYKGIPEDIPIETIEIRNPPEKEKGEDESESEEKVTDKKPIKYKDDDEVEDDIFSSDNLEKSVKEYDEENQDFMHNLTENDVKNTLREFIIRADEIRLGQELDPIRQFVDVDEGKQRFNITAQTEDLLNELLSPIPKSQRTSSVLNNIHTMIDRFKQLRTSFSYLDEYGNIEGVIVKDATWKPLIKNLLNFKTLLYWLIPVVKNVKKVYDINLSERTEEYSDIISLNTSEDAKNIETIINTYKSNDSPAEQNKYYHLISELDPYFTPFDEPDVESLYDTICSINVRNDVNAIIDNLGDFYSSIVENDIIKTRRFVINRYNLGANKLEVDEMTSSKMVAHQVNLTPSDTLELKSILTLPEPAIRFSRVSMPNSSILEKSNLNTAFLNYWEFLKNKTAIDNVIVTDIDKELDFSETEFANNIKNYTLQLSEQHDGIGRVKLYKQFLKAIVPKTRVLFNMMKKYIKGKLSLYDVVNYLEPFLIYTDDLTFMQYKEIEQFLRVKTAEYNRNFKEREKAFALLRKKKTERISNANKLLLFILDKKMQNDVYGGYDFDTSVDKSSSDGLWKMLKFDFSNCYNNALALANMKTMLSTDISNILENVEKSKDSLEKEIDNEESKSNSKCQTIVIAKQYNTLEDVAADNDKITYFDKKFDDTQYSVLDEFQKEQISMPPEEFYEFLVKKLIEKKKIDPKDAPYLAETLINGMRRVVEDDFATMYEPNEDKLLYFKRSNNRWKQDKTIDESLVSNNPSLLCEFQKGCIEVDKKYKAICETQDLNKKNITENMLKEIVNQFDKKYEMSKDKLRDFLTGRIDYSLSIIGKLKNLHHISVYKYNDLQYKLGLHIDEDNSEDNTVISPYVKLRDMILGQSNFSKKQNDIVRFTVKFTREALESNEEDIHWRYCVQTSTKLLPSFIYEIAYTWVEEPEKFSATMDKIIPLCGAISDDGDSWVDKYSGYVIRAIDFDIDEGYEDGYKAISREIMEKDAGDAILSAVPKPIKRYSTPESKIMFNVINALSNNLGINLDNQIEFIIGIASTTLFGGALISEESHKKRIEEQSKKGKKELPYKTVYNSTILYLTLGAFLIGIQTSIPSIKTKKTFPGCVRSFVGYPFEGTGDLSSLQYIACVAYKIKSSADPWSCLSKMKETTISEKIKAFIDTYYLSNTVVMQKFADKIDFLLTSPNEDIPEEHNLKQWNQFLPPLVPIKIRQLTNISEEFKKECLRNFKSGASCQREKVLVIKSKIIFFSLAIQEKIQGIVAKKSAILENSAGEPFIENACCSGNNKMTIIDYFMDKNEDIAAYNKIVFELSNIIDDINAVARAPLFFCKENDKNIYSPLTDKYNEETIYLSFILFCKFGSVIPITPELEAICGGKPEHFSSSDSISEQIRKLKQDGKIYNNDAFLRLLQLVNRKNMVPVSTEDHITTPLQLMRNTVEKIRRDDDETIPSTFRDRLDGILDTFDIAAEKEDETLIDLKNYLASSNKEMKREVIEFIKSNSNMSKSVIKNITEFLNTFFNWENEDKDTIYNSIQFIKDYISKLSNIFPSIILNKQDFQSTVINKYWGLSKNHENDIKGMISDYYKLLRSFYQEGVLTNILGAIIKNTKNLLDLAMNTTYMNEIEYGDRTVTTILDKRTTQLLFEYYFLTLLSEYKRLSEDQRMLIKSFTGDANENDGIDEASSALEDIDEDEIMLLGMKNPTLLMGNIKDMKNKTAKLIGTFISIIATHKDKIFLNYDTIMDKVFKGKESEKNRFTDRLQALTDEERNVDTILKINKLGVWSKGLQKGLTSYVKETYDEEREYAEKIDEIERRLRKNKNVTDGNVEQYLEDYIDDLDVTNDIENEEYNLSNYLGDDMGENYDGYENDPDDWDLRD
jgi:hypothetical protein